MEKVEIFELCQKEMGVDSTIFVTSWKEIQAYSHANIYTHTENELNLIRICFSIQSIQILIVNKRTVWSIEVTTEQMSITQFRKFNIREKELESSNHIHTKHQHREWTLNNQNNLKRERERESDWRKMNRKTYTHEYYIRTMKKQSKKKYFWKTTIIRNKIKWNETPLVHI